MPSTNKIIRYLHLWPGLVSAVLVVFVCITGTLIVYSDEIIEWSAGEAGYVGEVKSQKLPVHDILTDLQAKYPHRQSSYLVAYKDPERSIRVNMYSKDEGLRMVYIDPYTGKILKDDPTINFFFVTAHLHSSLMLGKTGEWIVDIATVVFVVELLTGLILWLPRKWNRHTFRNFFTVNFRSTGKRLNHDLHRILGIYALILMLILSITGLLIAFKPLSNSTMKLLGAGADGRVWRQTLPSYNPDHGQTNLNSLLTEAFERYPGKKEVQVDISRMQTKGHYFLRVADRIGLKSSQNPEYLLYNRTRGEVIHIPQKVIKHDKMYNTIWALHTGNWLGPWGKLTTFVVGLISGSLPITGYFIWRNKQRARKRRIATA